MKNNFTFYFSLRITFSHFTSPLFSKVHIKWPPPLGGKEGASAPPPSCAYDCNTKKKNRIHSSVFWQVSHSPKLCIYHSSCPLFQISHVYNGIEIPFFCQRRRRLRWHSIYFMFIWLQTQKGNWNSK